MMFTSVGTKPDKLNYYVLNAIKRGIDKFHNHSKSLN